MFIKNEFDEIKLPDIYNREGKDCYFDIYRKKLIKITKVETVRQKTAGYFELKLGVPREMIDLGVQVRDDSNDRPEHADIVIYAADDRPMAVAVCGRENEPLKDKFEERAKNYCKILGGRYIVITNGKEIEMAVYDDETDELYYIDGLLSYEEMIEEASEEFAFPEPAEKFERYSLDELKDQEILKEYDSCNESGRPLLGEKTKPEKRSFAVNFYQALLDSEHKLPVKKFKTFEILEDVGLRRVNKCKGYRGYYEGIYRCFLVKDRFKGTQLVSLTIAGLVGAPEEENRESNTIIVAAIDKFKEVFDSLQYNIDKQAKDASKVIMRFKHNAKVGGVGRADVIDKVSMLGCSLTVSENIKKQGNRKTVSESKVELGELHTDKLLYLDDEEVSGFVYKIIEYALLITEARNSKRGSKK